MTQTDTTQQPGTAVAVATPRPQAGALAPMGVFDSVDGFELAQRMVKPLVDSVMVPEAYRGNIGNALIALDISRRAGANVLMVMQNLHIIEGRPSWSSQYVIAALNSCGLFSPLRFVVEDLGETPVEIERWEGPKGQRTKVTTTIKVQNKRFVAWAYDKATGERLEGPEVTIAMAAKEGWYTKPGSKWLTMPDLMGRYRSAKFFGNMYAPHILMGMHTDDEVQDMVDITPPASAVVPPPQTDEPARKVAGEVLAPENPPASGKGGGKRSAKKPAETPAAAAQGAPQQDAKQQEQQQAGAPPFDMPAAGDTGTEAGTQQQTKLPDPTDGEDLGFPD